MRNKVPLLMSSLSLVGLFLAHPVSAAPYPLGTMTCDDIGAFASEASGKKEFIDSSGLCFWKLWS